ncbi:hypothetical protein PITC_021360 [Penicillium italicum]|uniref:Uncharacterized protein n=1 Tax=Penicillium italicum TaxID=40296 RepID=A0A0A2KNL3_PENIT|nr:hypothetical protein PITC_021360 [Penicillium italicum]
MIYNIVEPSRSRLCGMIAGADPQDNSDAGTVKHNS